MDINIYFFTGLLGILCLLASFTLVESKKITGTSNHYILLNFFGSFFLMIYSIYTKNVIFIMFNLVWAGIAIYMAIRHSTEQASD